MRQKLTELRRKIEKSTIIAGDLNTPLLVIDRISKQKLSKDTGDMNSTTN